MKLHCILGPIILGTLASPVLAQDINRDAELFASWINELDFQTYIKTPDVLDPAIVPFLDCMLSNAGSTLLDEEGKPREVAQSGVGCPNERAEARSLGIEILKQEGMSSPELQNALIDETFRAVELMAASNRSWAGSRKHAPLPSPSGEDREMAQLEGPTTSVTWQVDDQGHMTSCTVTKTSGDPKLDQQACEAVRQRQPSESGETTVLIRSRDESNAPNQ